MSRNSILHGVVLSFFLTSLAQASSPSLGGIEPRGIQRGQVQELSFNGSRLADAVEILFYDPAGFKVQELKAVANSVKVKVLVSPDCRMGQHGHACAGQV